MICQVIPSNFLVRTRGNIRPENHSLATGTDEFDISFWTTNLWDDNYVICMN